MKNKDKLTDLLGNKLLTAPVILLNKREDIYSLLRRLINVYRIVYTALTYHEQTPSSDILFINYIQNKEFNVDFADRTRKLDRKGDFKWSPVELEYNTIHDYPCYLEDFDIEELNLDKSLKLMKEYDMEEDLVVVAIGISCNKLNKINWIPVIFKNTIY